MSRPPDQAIPGPETTEQARWTTDRLISIGDIRSFFKLGRTAAYELTHRPEFPEPVPISPRCYRWWASEVDAFAVALRMKRSEQSVRADSTQRATKPHASHPATPPRRITGKVRAARTRKETL
jgi:predicted DNA-binding transcriptional regulator AlpA